jgi:hypothetical protein
MAFTRRLMTLKKNAAPAMYRMPRGIRANRDDAPFGTLSRGV